MTIVAIAPAFTDITVISICCRNKRSDCARHGPCVHSSVMKFNNMQIKNKWAPLKFNSRKITSRGSVVPSAEKHGKVVGGENAT